MNEESYSPFSLNDMDKSLLTAPKNTRTKRIFVAGTRMNQGKTTCSLGIFNALSKITNRIGYIKPLGQRFVTVGEMKVDEDSVLLDRFFNLSNIPIKAMSPVTVDSGYTRKYLEDPKHELPHKVDEICRAFDRASFDKDYIIIEGSGHAGVGACIGLSNAEIAKLLNAKVILVAEAGVGSAIDEIYLNKAPFDQLKVPVIGVILNKALGDKKEMIRDYAGKGLRTLNVDLLGVLPLKPLLHAPNLSQLINETGGTWLNGEKTAKNERITQIVIGPMTPTGNTDYMKRGVLILATGAREDILEGAVSCNNEPDKQVSGIFLTNGVRPRQEIMEMLSKTDIPVIISEDDGYKVMSRINKVSVKTQPQDDDKFEMINDLFRENITIQPIIDAFEKTPNTVA